jgi:hypothetical protein
VLTPVQRADLMAGGIDARLVTTLAAIGRRHSVIITALQSDHYPGTNHEAGRAMDIGAVDGEVCDGDRTGACAQLVRELAATEGRLRSTELIHCWDPDGSADPRGFARADHCDHIHWAGSMTARAGRPLGDLLTRGQWRHAAVRADWGCWAAAPTAGVAGAVVRDSAG